VGFYRTSKEARKLSATKEYSDHIAAVAVMTNHISTKLVLDLYLKIDKPVTLTKAFTDRNLALKWLEEKRVSVFLQLSHLKDF
jgi:thiamine pyrophosphokinase